MTTNRKTSKDDKHSSPEKSKIWSITTPEEAAIVTKASYRGGALLEISRRKQCCLNEGDVSAADFWDETYELVKLCPYIAQQAEQQRQQLDQWIEQCLIPPELIEARIQSQDEDFSFLKTAGISIH